MPKEGRNFERGHLAQLFTYGAADAGNAVAQTSIEVVHRIKRIIFMRGSATRHQSRSSTLA